MRTLTSLLLLVACGTHEPPTGGPQPWDLVGDKISHAKLEVLEARERVTDAAYEKEEVKWNVTTTTDQVAALAAGWNQVRVTAYPTGFWTVWADGNEVLAAGFQNWMVHSTDGGASWKRVDTSAFAKTVGDEKQPLISKVWGAGDHRVAIGFENDLVGMSKDRGATWTTIALPFSRKPDGDTLFFQNEPRALWGAGKDVYITTDPSIDSKTLEMFVSHDGGETWKPSLHLESHGGNDSLFELAGTSNGGEVYAIGHVNDKPAMYRSRDRGASWQPVHVPAWADNVESIAVAGSGDLYVHFGIADQGKNVRDHTIAHTSDGGGNWTRTPIKYLGDAKNVTGERWWEPEGLYLSPDHTLYVTISGRATELLESTRDGGRTWKLELADEQPDSLAFGAGKVYAAEHDATVAVWRPVSR
jgi:photosystem II stability/assembly factor-like uncharacterized protein